MTEQTLASHHKTMDVLLEKYPYLYSLDFRYLLPHTRRKYSAFHLTDVNMLKALIIVNIMGKFSHDPAPRGITYSKAGPSRNI